MLARNPRSASLGFDFEVEPLIQPIAVVVGKYTPVVVCNFKNLWTWKWRVGKPTRPVADIASTRVQLHNTALTSLIIGFELQDYCCQP